MYSIIPGLEEDESIICGWQYRLFGSFHAKLFDCLSAADQYNLERLRLGFPKEVAALERYCYEAGWWSFVSKKFASIRPSL
jgi:hypothetical protein